jgi:hypothetical protein
MGTDKDYPPRRAIETGLRLAAMPGGVPPEEPVFYPERPALAIAR